MTTYEYTAVDCTVQRTSPKAVLIRMPFPSLEEHWVPRSTLSTQSAEKVQTRPASEITVLRIASWFVKKEGINA